MKTRDIYKGILFNLFGKESFNENQWYCVDKDFKRCLNSRKLHKDVFRDKKDKKGIILKGTDRDIMESMFKNGLKGGYTEKSPSKLIVDLKDFLDEKFSFNAAPLLTEYSDKEDNEARIQTAVDLFNYVLTSIEGKDGDEVIDLTKSQKLMRERLDKFVTRDSMLVSLSAEYKSIEPFSGKCFCNREYVIKEIDAAFEENRVVFLCGYSGTGKSEICRGYGKIHKTDFKNVIPVRFKEDGSGSVEDIKKQIEHSHKECATQIDAFSLISEKDLVIIDNFNDVGNIYVFRKLLNRIPYAKILVTSQIYSDEMKTMGKVLELEILDNENLDARNKFAIDIFCRYAEIAPKKCDRQELQAIEEALNSIDYHAMIIALLGRQYKRIKIRIKEYCETIKRALGPNIRVTISKDSVPYAKTPDELVKTLFKHRVLEREFEEIERQVLGAILLWQPYTSNVTMITRLVGDNEEMGLYEARSAMIKLHEDGLIYLESDEVYIHSLIQKLLKDNAIVEDGRTIADLSYEFNVHLLKNRMVEEYSVSHPEISKYKNHESAYKYKSWFNYLLKELVMPHKIEDDPELKKLLHEESHYWCTCRSETGAAVFVHFESGKDYCILDGNNQKLADYRYFCKNKEYPIKVGFDSCNLVQYKGEVPEDLVLPEFVVGAPVEYLGSKIFFRKSNIRKVTLPSHLKTIPGYAFSECESIEEIVFPNNLLAIGPKAFYGCKKLKNIKIDNCSYLKQISVSAFSRCHSVEGCINLPANLEVIQSYAFFECSCITDIWMGNKVVDIGEHTFEKCRSLEKIAISKKIEKIPKGAFKSCVNLEKVIIPGSVKIIEQESFYNCSNLKHVIIEDGVKEIETYAFFNCEKLEDIDIPDSLRSVGNGAIKDCPNINVDTYVKMQRLAAQTSLKYHKRI